MREREREKKRGNFFLLDLILFWNSAIHVK